MSVLDRQSRQSVLKAVELVPELRPDLYLAQALSVGFAILGAVTFSSLGKVYKHFPPGHYQRVLNGTMLAALMGPILVVALDLVSLIILFYKTWKHNGTGFSYGFLDASYLNQGLFVLLSSFVLLSDRDILEDFRETPLWTKVDSTVYTMTYVMGFIVTGAFILLFFLLIFCQGAVRDHNRRVRRQQIANGEYEDSLLGSEPNTPRHHPPQP